MGSFSSDKFIKHVYTANDSGILSGNRVSHDQKTECKVIDLLSKAINDIAAIKKTSCPEEKMVKLDFLSLEIENLLSDLQNTEKNKQLSASIKKLLKQ